MTAVPIFNPAPSPRMTSSEGDYTISKSLHDSTFSTSAGFNLKTVFRVPVYRAVFWNANINLVTSESIPP